MKRADRGCALLVFAKEPRSGAVKTRLVPFVTEGEAAAVYAAFLEDAASQFAVVAAEVGCDIRYHVIGDHIVPIPMPRTAIRLDQEGDDLGSRMSNAFSDAFAAGYGRVVIVGTDHPTLPSAFLVRAFTELDQPSRVVIGPSDDGGYYLLGMNAFYPALFEGMTYSHPDVFSETMERARAAAKDVVILPRWYDVDTPDTLIRLWGEINGSPRIVPATHAVLSRLATRYEWSIRWNMQNDRLEQRPEIHLETLEQFIIERQGSFAHSTGAFSRLIRDLSVAGKIVNRDMRRAGLVDISGTTGEVNVQGEIQQKMDLLAHREFVRALRRGGECCLIGSEEHAEAIPISTNSGDDGQYIVLLDPLDGSSNIEVNVSVGTIFSIYRLPKDYGEPDLGAALQAGINQIGAGYIVYGSSTMFVYTTGDGVNGFTLEPSLGEFLLSHPDIQTPKNAKVYSINEGNYNSFDGGLRSYIKWMQELEPSDGRPYSTRYIGSFVSDFHRNLLKGGIYIYPATEQNKTGKLRLMYEANPLAFIVEQAGGRASDGVGRILDKTPAALHERTPLYIGSEMMVRKAEQFLSGELAYP